MHDAVQRSSAGSREALERAVGADGLTRRRPRVLPRPAEGAARRASGRSPSRCTTARDHRRPSGRASTTRRYGLAVDIGSTTIAAHLCDLATGEVARLGRRDEPADPLRRGSDEPRLLRDDEPGRRQRADRVPCARRLDELTAELAQRGRRRARRHPRDRRSSATRSCITSCSASTRPSSAARRSRSPSTRRCDARPRELGLAVAPGARAYVAALHRRPCRRRHRRRDPLRGAVSRRRGHAARRRRHQRRDRARQPRPAARLLLARPGPAFEGAQICCGQRAAPGAIERVRIDPRDARAALQGDRLRPLVGRAGLRRATPTGVTGICGSGIIEVDRRDATSPAIITHGRRRSTARSRRARRGSSPTGAPSPTSSRDGEPRLDDHPERRARRSSSPRRRSMPAARC